MIVLKMDTSKANLVADNQSLSEADLGRLQVWVWLLQLKVQRMREFSQESKIFSLKWPKRRKV